jgi:hypothetical protein
MTKQGQFQVDNFNYFHNSDLGSDLERIITSAESLYENDESLSISKDFEESFDYPYGVCVEGTSYWYVNEDERDEDLKLLVDLVAGYCIVNYYSKDLKAKFNAGDKILEIFHRGKLIHVEPMSDTKNYWFDLNIGIVNMEFNFCEDEFRESNFVLTLHAVIQDVDEFFHKDINEKITLEIETK